MATSGPTSRRYTRSITGHPSPHLDYPVGVCDECLTLDPDAPGSAVRAALRVLGKNEADWPLAADAFNEADVDTTFLMYDSKVRPEPQRKPWGHVTKDEKAVLRAGYARVLDYRVHAAAGGPRVMPEKAPPSGPRGCLLCGVAKSLSWRSVLTGALTRGPEMVDGHLCGTCSDVYASVGALGPTLIEKACLEAQGLPWSENMRAPGLRAWIAMDLPPGEPWSWVTVRPPEPVLDPMNALRDQVADLQAEVAALRAEVGR